MQLVQSGGHAKLVIEDGLVIVNGEVESRKRKKMRDGDVAEMDGQKIVVQKA
jgi:ribosome-associated protein